MSHTYATAGTYTAQLTVTDNTGARSSDGAVVTVGTAAASGALRWARRYGSTATEVGAAVQADGQGNVVVQEISRGRWTSGAGR